MSIFPSPFLTAHHPCLLSPSCSPGTWGKEAHPDSSSKFMFQVLCAHTFSIYFLRVWIFCSHVCLCTIHMPDALPGEKRASDPLKLHLEIIVSHQVASGNWTLGSSARARSALNCWAFSLVSQLLHSDDHTCHQLAIGFRNHNEFYNFCLDCWKLFSSFR